MDVYPQLGQIVVRAINLTKSGTDVERAFVYFSELTRTPGAQSMSNVTKETRVMANWNKEDIAKNVFGVNEL